MVTMEEAIARTIERMETTAGDRATNDCVAIMGAYVEMIRGVNPFAAYLGTYRTDKEAWAVLRKGGGMRKMVEQCMAEIGVRMHLMPKRGDIVTAEIRGEPSLGLFLGPRVSFKSAKGRMQMRVSPTGVWTCA